MNDLHQVQLKIISFLKNLNNIYPQNVKKAFSNPPRVEYICCQSTPMTIDGRMTGEKIKLLNSTDRFNLTIIAAKTRPTPDSRKMVKKM